MASVIQKSNGTWMARNLRIKRPGHNETDKPFSKLIPNSEGMSEKEAKAAAADMQFQLDHRMIGTDKVTFGEYASDFVENRHATENGEIKASTKAVYRNALKLHINPVFGHVRLTDVTRLNVEQAFNIMRTKRKLAKASTSKVKQLLGLVFQAAYEDGIIPQNWFPTVPSRVFRGAKEKKQTFDSFLPEGRQKAFEVELVPAMFEYVNSKPPQPIRPAVYLCYYLGLRRGEALGLEWSDIKWNEQVVEVRQQYAVDECGQEPTIRELKTRSSLRRVHMDENLAAFLRSWKDLMEEKHDGKLPKYICQVKGYSSRPQTLTNRFRNMCELIGSEKSLHGLRHLHASMLLDAKTDDGQALPLKAIANRLGHSSLEQLLKTYSHELPGQDEKIADTIGATFGAF